MPEFKIRNLRQDIKYIKQPPERGYTNTILSLDLSKDLVYIKPVGRDTRNAFIGGKGYGLRMLWNAVRGEGEPGGPTRWNDPHNAVCIACGPLGGIPDIPGSGKCIVTSISPLTSIPIDSNVGGYIGSYLKFSGFDALEITGKTKKDTILFVDGIENKIYLVSVSGLPEEAHEASEFLTRHPFFSGGKPENVAVVVAGTAARHTLIGCLNFSLYDTKRGRVKLKQAGRGGIGSVFADKGIGAVVIKCDRDAVNTEGNHPADIERLRKSANAHMREIVKLDPKQNEMRAVGTAHLTSIMNAYKCLPIKNFRFGNHPDASRLDAEVFRGLFDKGYDGCCKGCPVSCAHGIKKLRLRTGPYKDQEVFVDGPEYETIAGCGANLGIFDPHYIAEINFYCDTYSLDTISVGTGIAFVMECSEKKLIRPARPVNFGDAEAALGLIHEMARGVGFGRIAGFGIRRMKELFVKYYEAEPQMLADIGMEAKGLEFSEYICQESLAQQGGYGLALKGPQHDEAWLIFLDMVHNLMPTFERKAEYLHWFPMWRTWFGLCGLCKLPWNDIVPEDNRAMAEPAKVMQHVEWYAEYFSAVTGREVKPDDLIVMSERVYNFQRLFNLRMGYGKSEFDNIPYRAMGPVMPDEYEARRDYYNGIIKSIYGEKAVFSSTAKKIELLRRHRVAEYEKLKQAVYKRRGWTEDGIPTLATVKRLGIDYPQAVQLLRKHGVTE